PQGHGARRRALTPVSDWTARSGCELWTSVPNRSKSATFGDRQMNPDNIIRIMTVDDHQLIREGIATIINNQPDMRQVAQASSGPEGIRQYRDHRPDITLMDLRLPGLSGIDAMIAIRSEFPDARIVILTTFDGDVEVQRALRAGA